MASGASPIGLEHGGTSLVELLLAHGVDAVFGLPGGQTAALYDAIDRNDRIRHVGVLDERSAAYAADAYARLTGRVGVCDATVGPGATKLPSGLGEALNSSIPVLAIVSDLPRSTRARRYRGATSQALDQEALLQPVTKWVGAVEGISDLGPVVRRAFREATSGRPGPVAVIIPQDLLDGPVPDDPQSSDAHAIRFGRFPSTPVVPAAADLDALHDALDSAERPILVVGGGGNRSGVASDVARLADTGIAVATTLSGRGVIDERHPMAVGVLGSLGVPSARSVASEADLIIAAGTKLGSGTTLGYTFPAPGQRVAQIDIDPAELGRDRPVEIAVHGDVAETLRRLDPSSAPISPWRDRVAAERAAWADRRRKLAGSDNSPLDPQRVMAELDRILRPTDVVVSDASLASGWVAGYLTVTADGPRTLFPRGLAGLGWAIPAAVGATETGADRVVAIMGDGAAPYAIGELATLARQDVPVLALVLNNSSYGWIRWYRRMAFNRGWEHDDLPPTSFAAVGAAYGFASVRVDTPSDLDAAFEGWNDGHHLIEVITSVWETPIDAHRDAVDRGESGEY